MAMAGDVEVLVPLEGLVDNSAERAQLKRISPSSFRSATTSKGKLGNKNFVDRAPLEVLDKVRARLAEVEAAIAKIEEALKRLG